MKNKQQHDKHLGIADTIALTLSTIDTAEELSDTQKREMLYSTIALSRIFDIPTPPKFLQKYGLIKGEKLPSKLELYELVYKINTLKNATLELKALWYINFMHILCMEPPHDAELYDKLLNLLSCEPVLECVLQNTFSVYLPNSTQELECIDNFPHIAIDWLSDYIAYKGEILDGGFSRDEERYKKWLSEGRFTKVFIGTEMFLDSFPDNDSMLLLNLAARTSLEGALDENTRKDILIETLDIIDDRLAQTGAQSEKTPYFYYYKALAHIGLHELEKAKSALNKTPNFDPAIKLLKAIQVKGL